MSVLQRIFSGRLIPCHACFFIDGLDEFIGNYDRLVSTIEVMIQDPKVKVCASSRPYRAFRDSFDSVPNLKLQDLTKQDIQEYATNRLNGLLREKKLASQEPSWLPQIVEMIVEKAEGVFLWVRLAVDDQIEGARNGDTLVKLTERLDLLPSEMEDLYNHMLKKINVADRKEAVQYLRLVLTAEGKRPLLLRLALAVYDRIDDLLRMCSGLSSQDVKHHCDVTVRRLNAICAGFLEIQSIDFEDTDRGDSKSDDQRPNMRRSSSGSQQETDLSCPQISCWRPREALDYARQYVQFLHRTTFDFFLENEQARQYLRKHSVDDFDPYSSYVKAELGTMVLLTMSKKGLELYSEERTETHEDWQSSSDSFGDYVNSVMRAAAALESHSGRACITQIDHIDKIITELYRRYDNQDPPLHWSARWHREPSYILQESGRTLDSQPKDGLDLEQGFSGLVPFRPVEFLGLTAYYGLSSFVQHKMQFGVSPFHENTPSYLLCCVVARYHDASYYGERSLELIAFLLDNGADPNMMAFGSTIWRSMLVQMSYGCGLEPSLKRTWVKIITALLAKNVDVHLRVKAQLGTRFADAHRLSKIYRVLRLEKPLSFNGSEGFFIYLVAQSSASAILEGLVGEEPGFEEIKKILVAKDARLESSVSDLIFEFDGGRPDETHNLSKMQADRILEAYYRKHGRPHGVVTRIDFNEALYEFIEECAEQETEPEDDSEDDDSIYFSPPSTPKSDHGSDLGIVD